MSAEVLCFRRALLPERSGLVSGNVRELFERIDADKRFMDRGRAQSSDSYVQVIACAVVATRAGCYHVFETPPADSYDSDGPLSLIVGGHIDRQGPADETRSLDLLAREALRRELLEELGRESDTPPALVGVLIGRSSLKNSRHIGMLYEFRMEGPLNPVAEEEFRLDSEFAGMYEVEELRRLRGRMDPWSAMFTDSQ